MRMRIWSWMLTLLCRPVAHLSEAERGRQETTIPTCVEQGSPPKLWTIIVYDNWNWHRQDEKDSYEWGKFESYEEAEIVCRQIVDRSLEGSPAKNAAELHEYWRLGGDNPFIYGPDTGKRFLAYEYAEQRCAEIFAGG